MTLYFNREESIEGIEGVGGIGGRDKPYIGSILLVYIALSLSLVGFFLSILTIRRIQTPAPVQILCDSDDLRRSERAGEVLEKLIKK